MSLTTQRNNIIHRILAVSDLKLLNEIEDLLNKDVFAYTTARKPLDVQEYKEHLDQIILASDAGAVGYTTTEAKNQLKRK
jgi:tRNA A37 N6-isopentenylltransferase MiaA